MDPRQTVSSEVDATSLFPSKISRFCSNTKDRTRCSVLPSTVELVTKEAPLICAGRCRIVLDSGFNKTRLPRDSRTSMTRLATQESQPIGAGLCHIVPDSRPNKTIQTLKGSKTSTTRWTTREAPNELSSIQVRQTLSRTTTPTGGIELTTPPMISAVTSNAIELCCHQAGAKKM